MSRGFPSRCPHRWSPESHAIKDFMARNRVPYQWVDVEAQDRDEATRQLVEALGDTECLPLVLFPDGTRQTQPSITQIANELLLMAKLPTTQNSSINGSNTAR